MEWTLEQKIAFTDDWAVIGKPYTVEHKAYGAFKLAKKQEPQLKFRIREHHTIYQSI